jgi:hypothetical protein
MKRATSFGVIALGAALTVACGNNRTAANNNDTGANAPAAAEFRNDNGNVPRPVDVEGCLTASGGQFVLTALQNAAPAGSQASGGNSAAAGSAQRPGGQSPVPTTETYQLVSAGDNDLQKYVGQQVRVTGEADPARVADVRELTPATPAQPERGQPGSVGTTGNAAGNTNSGPKVTTESTTHFEYRKLRVSAVTPAGGACPAAPAQSR